MLRGMSALLLALGLTVSAALAGDVVINTPPPPRDEAPAAAACAQPCNPDLHCAAGGGQHFNLACGKNKCEGHACHQNKCDSDRVCGQWHKCGETHLKGDHHHQHQWWKFWHCHHGCGGDGCHRGCGDRGACAHAKDCHGWYQCEHRHLTPAEQTTRCP